MNISITQFDAYVQALATHDWNFEYSDDQKAWRKGWESNKNITSQAARNPILQDAYSTYSASVMSSSGSLLQRIERREAAIDKLRDVVIEHQFMAA